jgi:hypothetical protein
MTRYIFSTKHDGKWIMQAPDYHGHDEITTKQAAINFYDMFVDEGETHIRIERLDDNGTFSDVSNEIIEASYNAALDIEVDAAMDRAHERQERHSWEQV